MRLPGIFAGVTFFAISAFSQDAAELYRAGMRYFSSGQRDAAIEALGKSLGMQPANPPGWKALGVAFASNGEIARAEEPFRNACSQAPQLEDACLYYGRTLYLL